MTEPVHIKDILPGVMNDIGRRASVYSDNHRRGVLGALRAYKGGHRPARRRTRSRGETGASLAYSGKLLKGGS